MALSLQDGGLVWQKVKKALTGANPAAQEAFNELRKYFATQGGNPQLQFIPFSDAEVTQATGVSPIGAVTSTVYGLYAKKGDSDTDCVIALVNQVSNTTVALHLVSVFLQTAKDEAFVVNPKGVVFATDLTISGETTAYDGTEVAAGAAGGGFVIVGA